MATSFGTEDRCQSFHGRWHEAINSLYVGGDYRIYHTTLSGNELNFAIRGKWSFTDEEWMRRVRAIIDFERVFWHDNDFPYFLVTLTPLTQDHGSTGGTGLTNSFMMHLSRLDSLPHDTLATIAHETFHSWNPNKIGAKPGSDYPVSWFCEGFTVYYADLLLFRAGLISFPDYVAGINEKLRRYKSGEGTEVTLQDFVGKHSANDAVLNQLDYRRGAVLAIWLDANIRRKTGNRSSLDRVTFDLVHQNAAYGHRHDEQPMVLTNQRIFRAASKYLGRDLRKQLRQYVERGGDIQVPQTALGPCAQSRAEISQKFDLGFDRSSISQPKVVFGVELGSEAYKAGVRDGQKMFDWSIDFDDSSKEVRLRVLTDHGDQILQYYPRAAEGGSKFDLGFDRNSLKGSLVFGVEPGSEAYKAGLRDGQRMVGWSFYIVTQRRKYDSPSGPTRGIRFSSTSRGAQRSRCSNSVSIPRSILPIASYAPRSWPPVETQLTSLRCRRQTLPCLHERIHVGLVDERGAGVDEAGDGCKAVLGPVFIQ